MADKIFNVLLDPVPGVDFVATPNTGTNKLTTQFMPFLTDTERILNSLTAPDSITNTL